MRSRQLIAKSCASPSNNLISLSYSMPVFSANLFGFFVLVIMTFALFLILQPHYHYWLRYRVVPGRVSVLRVLGVSLVSICVWNNHLRHSRTQSGCSRLAFRKRRVLYGVLCSASCLYSAITALYITDGWLLYSV